MRGTANPTTPVRWTAADREIIAFIRSHEPRPYPSAATCSRATGYTVRTVRRTIAKMKALGWNVEQRWRPNGSQASNAYHLPQPSVTEARERSYAKAAERARRERVTPRRSNQRTFTLPFRKSAEARNFGRRARWKQILMGDLVPSEGQPPAPSSNKELGPASSAEIGQALFAAIEDQGTALGVRWPRTQIAITVRNAKPSLKDGIDPNLVLASCIIALRRGEPHVVGKIILDGVNSKAGLSLTRTEYERILALENSLQNSQLQRLRRVLRGDE